jgi:hypothetical protein
MLRLRSDVARRDLRVTEQNTDVFFVPTLSGLSGEFPSTPTGMTGYGNEEDSELKQDREQTEHYYEGVACKRGNS